MLKEGANTTAAKHNGKSEGSWLEFLRWGALTVFLALPVCAFLVPNWAGRIFWTVLLPIAPLLIVIAGYHRWRRICPLAWFANLPTRLGHPGERRASASLQQKYYYLIFSVFLASLWLRLVATNGNGPALALFLILLSLAALLLGTFFTGKTWCNYICPVSFVEKIYTEPRGLRPTTMEWMGR